MNANKKYFGMTTMQIGILGGLGVALLLIVGCGGWFIVRGASTGLFSPPVATLTSTPEPTVTPIVYTTPTAIPTVATTPIPYEQLIPKDWKQYKTTLVEIWMPSNFKLPDKKTKDTSTKIAVNALLLTEVPSKSSAYSMITGVFYDLMSGDSIDAYLDAKLKNLPEQSRVADRKTVFVNSVEARRLMIETRLGTYDEDHLVYVFLDGSTVWFVEYAAEISEFFQNLPIFEQSILTFRVVR